MHVCRYVYPSVNDILLSWHAYIYIYIYIYIHVCIYVLICSHDTIDTMHPWSAFVCQVYERVYTPSGLSHARDSHAYTCQSIDENIQAYIHTYIYTHIKTRSIELKELRLKAKDGITNVSDGLVMSQAQFSRLQVCLCIYSCVRHVCACVCFE